MTPHQWNGSQWTCLQCGHVSPDPCDCACHQCTAMTHTYVSYKRGFCRCPVGREAWRIYQKRCREGRSEMRRVPALGYQRRVHALQAIGWSYKAIGARGYSDVHHIDDYRYIKMAHAVYLDAVYARLADEDGPSMRSILWARKHDWAPPWAWEGHNIDDPAARPTLNMAPIVDEVLVDRVLQGKRSFRDLNPEERVAAYELAIRKGWSALQIQREFHINGSTLKGLRRAAA